MNIKDKTERKGFVSWLFDLLFGKNDPEREKKRLLKQTEELLKKQSKYFKASVGLMQPALGQYFYDIYIAMRPARLLLQNLNRSNQVKNIVVEAFLDKSRKELLKNFTPENAEKLAANKDSAAAQEQLRRECQFIVDFLKSDSIANQINLTYGYMRAFSDFAAFDYFHLARRFDPSIPESALNYKPSFQAADGFAAASELDEFAHAALPITSENNWDRLFDILNNYRNTEIIARDAWQRIFTKMKDFVRHNTFELMLKILKNDPFYEVKSTIVALNIVQPYINRLQETAAKLKQQLAKSEKTKMAHKIIAEIFNAPAPSQILENYTRVKSRNLFAEFNNDGFMYADLLNFCAAFADRFLEKDIKTLVDLLILKGTWTQNSQYKDFSHAFQELLAGAQAISEFDSNLNDRSPTAIKLRNALRKGPQDRLGASSIRNVLQDINQNARELIEAAMQNYTVLARRLKAYIDDYRIKPKSEIIINWKDIEHNFEGQLGRFMAALYTKLYYLLQIFQNDEKLKDSL